MKTEYTDYTINAQGRANLREWIKAKAKLRDLSDDSELDRWVESLVYKAETDEGVNLPKAVLGQFSMSRTGREEIYEFAPHEYEIETTTEEE